MLDSLFKPKSIAIIGASNNKLSISYRIMQNLMDYGFKGPIFPVHPKADHVKNFKAYKSATEIPQEIDLAHVVIRNTYVAGALKECAQKGVKTVIVNTSGFKEIGGEGIELERDLVELAKELNIRIFGPNCQGVMNTDPEVSLYSNFTFSKVKPGNISMVAQGGGVAEVLNNRLCERGIGIRMYASPGNACDISIPEILEYYGNDEETKVIVLHLESLDHAEEFMDVARKIVRQKPILAIKSGITAEGAKAVCSHTGGMMEQDTTIDIVFERCGIIRFYSEEELCDAAWAFSSQPVPKGPQVAVMTNTGSPAIIITDECIKAGLSMPDTSPEAKKTLKEHLFATASVTNPVDMMATATPEAFAITMETLLREKQMDSLIVCFVTPFFVDCEGVAREIARLSEQSDKTILAVVMTNEDWAGTVKIIKDAGIPVYYFPESAARALVVMNKFRQAREKIVSEEAPTSFKVDKQRASAILEPSPVILTLERSEGEESRFLRSKDVYELLSCYGIPVAKSGNGKTPEEIRSAAKRIGYPVALKAEVKDVVHKTDVGALALDVKNEKDLDKELEGFESKFGSKLLGCQVQEFLTGGREVIMGSAFVKGTGHTIMFGLGGIYVEIFKDVQYRMNPITKSQALEMIESTKAYPLLAGARGQEGVDIPQLVDVLLRLSQLVSDHPVIKELDFNPVIACGTGGTSKVVDARIRI